MIKDPEVYRNKKVVISGGGDSALDWSIFLSDVASEVTLIHRRNEFRGALDSVDKVQELKNSGKINMIIRRRSDCTCWRYSSGSNRSDQA